MIICTCSNKRLLPNVGRNNRKKKGKKTAASTDAPEPTAPEPTASEKAAVKQMDTKDKHFLAEMLQDMQRDLQRSSSSAGEMSMHAESSVGTAPRRSSLPASEVDGDDSYSLLSQEEGSVYSTTSLAGSLAGSVTSNVSVGSLVSLASVDTIGVRGRLLARLPTKYGKMKKLPEKDYAAPAPGQHIDLSKLQKILLRIGESFARERNKLDYDLSCRDDDPVSATELRERLRSDLGITTNTSDILLLFSKFDPDKQLVVDYGVVLSNARSIYANYAKNQATDNQILRLKATQNRLKEEREAKAEKRKRQKEKRLQKMRENGQAGGAVNSVLTEKAIAEAAANVERDRKRGEEQRVYLQSVINPSRRDIETVTEKLAIASYYYRAYHEQSTKTVVRSNYENVDVLLRNYAESGVSKISKSDFHNLLNYGLLFNVREFGDEQGGDVEPFTSKQLQIVDQRYRYDDAYSNAADGSNFRPIPTVVVGPDGEPEVSGAEGSESAGQSQGQAQNPFLFAINVDAFMKEFHALGNKYAQRLRKNDNIQSFLKAVSCPPTAEASDEASSTGLGQVQPKSADPNRLEAEAARSLRKSGGELPAGEDESTAGSSVAGGGGRTTKRSIGDKKTTTTAPGVAAVDDEMAESFIAMFRETVTAEINKSITGLQADGKPKRAMRTKAAEDKGGDRPSKKPAEARAQPVTKSRQRPQELRRSAASAQKTPTPAAAGKDGPGTAGSDGTGPKKLGPPPTIEAIIRKSAGNSPAGGNRSAGKEALRSPVDKPADSSLTTSETVGNIAGDLVRRKELDKKARSVSFSDPANENLGSNMDEEEPIPDYSPSPPGTAPTANETLSALLDGMTEAPPVTDFTDDAEVEEMLENDDL